MKQVSDIAAAVGVELFEGMTPADACNMADLMAQDYARRTGERACDVQRAVWDMLMKNPETKELICPM